MQTVSVIIPTYNRPKGLKAAVESVLRQSTEPSEIIIVNDGSKNEVLDDFSKYKSITVLHNEGNRGANFSRNRGAKESKGEILMFIDDDDSWNKDKIKNQLSVFNSDPKIGIVYSNRNVVNDDGEILKRITSNRSGNLYPDIFFSNVISTTSSVALKRDIFYEAGGFDEALPAMQDYDLWIRACKLCKVGLDSAYSLNYRVSESFENQITGSAKKKVDAVAYLLKKYQSEIRQFNFSERKKLYAKLYLSIARSCKSNSLALVKYCFLSFFSYPSAKSLAPLLPNCLKRIF